MLRNLGIRGQILAAFALPVLVLAVIGGLVIRHAAAQHRSADQTLVSAQSAAVRNQLADALARERSATVDALHERRNATTALTSARGAVDLLGAPTGLNALRARIEAGKVSPAAAVTRYAALIPASPTEGIALERLTGLEVIRAGRATTEQQRTLGRAIEEQSPANLRTTPQLDDARAALELAGTGGRPAVSLGDWKKATAARAVTLTQARDRAATEAVAAATTAADSARTRLTATAGGVVLAVLLSLLLALATARRISAPLRRLTEATTRLRDELPRLVHAVGPDDDADEIRVTGRDEVSRLAAAVVEVNRAVLDLAREQARDRTGGRLLDVARRNQVLLSRQLAIVDQLERVEGDQDVLEDLYRIDHLATRMRRNAESLFVLAGADSGRRLREPMSLSDVVRTATSEIEHYPRVALSLAADPAVSPHLALPTAHLLAELLENATTFSDPATTVVVESAETPDGVRLVITDEGPGLTDEELTAGLARLAEEPADDSPQLGLLVVGMLARQLDIRITLRPGAEGHGLAVVADLPNTLFAVGALAPRSRPEVTAQVPQLLPVSHRTAVEETPSALLPVEEPSWAVGEDPTYESYDDYADYEAGEAPAEDYTAEDYTAEDYTVESYAVESYAEESWEDQQEEARLAAPGVYEARAEAAANFRDLLRAPEPFVPVVPTPPGDDSEFGPEFGYDPDYEPELVDGYTYRPEPEPAVEEVYGEEAYADPFVGHELDEEPPPEESPEESPEEEEPAPERETGFPDILGPSTREILPQRMSIRTALMRGRRRPPRDAEEPEPLPAPSGRRDNFAELLDPEMEHVDYEGIPSPRGPVDDDGALPEPLLPWQREDD